MIFLIIFQKVTLRVAITPSGWIAFHSSYKIGTTVNANLFSEGHPLFRSLSIVETRTLCHSCFCFTFRELVNGLTGLQHQNFGLRALRH